MSMLQRTVKQRTFCDVCRSSNTNKNNNKYIMKKKKPYVNKSGSKRILCTNTLNNRKCEYGDKCDFAHSTTEQKLDPIRHKVYTLLTNNNDLSKINLVNDKKLFDTLLILTKVCNGCVMGRCPGGKNCREGAMNYKYRICYDDIMYGQCKRSKCKYIHLTHRGLVPYVIQQQHKKTKKVPQSTPKVNGMDLNDRFFLDYLSKKHHIGYNYASDSDDDDEDIEAVIKYLNDYSCDSKEEFLKKYNNKY